ncbi:unnamed protein product [Citrullus colocynthis]|uniref:Uncharacterized protein n=1 Tax=Citrullus colocynthis TaxID=252529 RepID=A0ABP0XWR4_9ROSI
MDLSPFYGLTFGRSLLRFLRQSIDYCCPYSYHSFNRVRILTSSPNQLVSCTIFQFLDRRKSNHLILILTDPIPFLSWFAVKIMEA